MDCGGNTHLDKAKKEGLVEFNDRLKLKLDYLLARARGYPNSFSPVQKAFMFNLTGKALAGAGYLPESSIKMLDELFRLLPAFADATRGAFNACDPNREPDKKQEKANDIQRDGDHYKKSKIQVRDFIVANNLNYLEGNAIKYITRHRSKNGKDDLLKATRYIQKLLEIEYSEETERNG
jgi:hypothetical protein